MCVVLSLTRIPAFDAVRQIRNISRVIWIHVALPPTTEQPGHIEGKTPTTTITPVQLRHRKTEALKLALCFAFAVKHYLRGEDGIHWDDMADVLPACLRHDESDEHSTRPNTPPFYAATRDCSNVLSHDGRLGHHTALDSECHSPDATKRVRPKRSKPNILSSTTPLLGVHTVDMNPDPKLLSMPLPLMFVSSSSRNDSCLN